MYLLASRSITNKLVRTEKRWEAKYKPETKAQKSSPGNGTGLGIFVFEDPLGLLSGKCYMVAEGRWASLCSSLYLIITASL